MEGLLSKDKVFLEGESLIETKEENFVYVIKDGNAEIVNGVTKAGIEKIAYVTVF